jgi:hypothetical protein
MSGFSEKLQDISRRRAAVGQELAQFDERRDALEEQIESGAITVGKQKIEVAKLEMWLQKLDRTLDGLIEELRRLREAPDDPGASTAPAETIVMAPSNAPPPPTGPITTVKSATTVPAKSGVQPPRGREEIEAEREAKREASLKEQEAKALLAARETLGAALKRAAAYETAKSKPTGAWPANDKVERSGTGQTAIFGKQNVAMSKEQLESTNARLIKNGSHFQFAPLQDVPVTIDGKPLVAVKPSIGFPPSGVDAALKARREKGEEVTYADCHRNAVVSLGFGYDPKSAKDCETPAIAEGVLPRGPMAAPKISEFKRCCKPSQREGNLGAKLIEQSSFIGNVAERGARSLIGGYLDKLAADPELKATFDTLDKAMAPNFDRARGEFEVDSTADKDLLAADFETLKSAKQCWNKYGVLSAINDVWDRTSAMEPAARETAARDKLRELYGNVTDNNAGMDDFVKSFPLEKAIAGYDTMCKELKLNKYCKPEPGQAMSMVTAGGCDVWKKEDTEPRKQELASRQRKYVAAILGVAPEQVDVDMILKLGDAGFPEKMEHCTKSQLAHVAERAGVDLKDLTPELYAGNREAEFPTEMDTWNFHWAAAVAEDGGDYMTLENFSVENPDAINGKQIFNAYGKDKSFYDHYKASGFFGGSCVALCFNPAGGT